MPHLRAPLAAMPLVLAFSASAQDKPAASVAAAKGADTYNVHCAVCHGKTGEGDGPMADQLRFAPPDLTRIARRNKGKFSPEVVARIVDGRQRMKGHGGPEMPIWGDAFLDSREGYSREAVRQKISEVVEYLATIQKP